MTPEGRLLLEDVRCPGTPKFQGAQHTPSLHFSQGYSQSTIVLRRMGAVDTFLQPSGHNLLLFPCMSIHCSYDNK